MTIFKQILVSLVQNHFIPNTEFRTRVVCGGRPGGWGEEWRRLKNVEGGSRVQDSEWGHVPMSAQLHHIPPRFLLWWRRRITQMEELTLVAETEVPAEARGGHGKSVPRGHGTARVQFQDLVAARQRCWATELPSESRKRGRAGEKGCVNQRESSVKMIGFVRPK